VCPFSTDKHSNSFSPPASTFAAPPSAAQIHTDLSREQVASIVPDRAQLTHFTSFSWPSSVAMHSKSPDDASRSQIAVMPSKPALARERPFGDQLTQRMVRE
jgi:hypothetical protein